MRLFGLIMLTLLVAPCSLWAQVLPIPPAPDRQREMQQYNIEVLKHYNSVMSSWRNAWKEQDARALARLYTDDAVLLPADREPVQGRGAIEAHFRESLDGTRDIQTGVADFSSSATLAVASGRYWQEVESEDGGVRRVSGTYMAVLRRDGRSWRIRSQLFRPDPAPEVASGRTDF